MVGLDHQQFRLEGQSLRDQVAKGLLSRHPKKDEYSAEPVWCRPRVDPSRSGNRLSYFSGG